MHIFGLCLSFDNRLTIFKGKKSITVIFFSNITLIEKSMSTLKGTINLQYCHDFFLSFRCHYNQGPTVSSYYSIVNYMSFHGKYT